MICILLLACCLPITVLATCPLPPDLPDADYPPPWIRAFNLEQTNDGTDDWINCPNDFVGKWSAGSKAYHFGTKYKCDKSSGKWIHPGDNYPMPPFASCGIIPAGSAYCHEQYCPTGTILKFFGGLQITSIKCNASGLKMVDEDGTVYNNAKNPHVECVRVSCQIWEKQGGVARTVALYPGDEQYCPVGTTLQFADGRPIKNIKCSDAGLDIETQDGLSMKYCNPTLTCLGATTTTSTTTVATTTLILNNPPSDPQCFWALNYYYNAARILHGFCAPTEQQGCSQMFSNGIGYDRSAGSGSLGNTITESCFYQMKQVCTMNYANLRRLHFHRVGNHYEHHLPVTADGGIFVGYAALQQDVMYAGDLSKNALYAGRVKNGGIPHFWLW